MRSLPAVLLKLESANPSGSPEGTVRACDDRFVPEPKRRRPSAPSSKSKKRAVKPGLGPALVCARKVLSHAAGLPDKMAPREVLHAKGPWARGLITYALGDVGRATPITTRTSLNQSRAARPAASSSTQVSPPIRPILGA